MEAWAEELRLVGRTVDKLGTDRAAVLTALQKSGKILNEDLQETVDCFLAGLGK